jgi:serine phosphatase RsbU (regulator of sigma subunit)
VDEYGGDLGKKFKAQKFKELLLSVQTEPLEKQKLIIDEAFETWRGNREQIDDVCVIGIRI